MVFAVFVSQEQLNVKNSYYLIYPCIMRTFFSQNEHVKLGVCIVHGCALYTDKYGIVSFIDS